jgi:2-dehydropantoate 2-reductase
MTVAIVGAGAIGGLIGAHLARSGQDVILIARGKHLEAMQARGVNIRSATEEFTVRPECTDQVSAIRRASVVFVTLKAHLIPALAPAIGESLAHRACVVGAMNGIPWWYFADRHLQSVDPGGLIARSIPQERVVGSVVYPAARIAEPGVIEHLEGNRLSIGEPDGTRSERVESITAMLEAAGFKARVQTRIRNEIWLKLVGNATLNPISVLTRATLAEILASPLSRELVRVLMTEVASVAEALGIELPLSIERRLEGAATVGEHQTSMLQDFEAGKSLEINALLGAVIELADGSGVNVPSLRLLYGLTKMLTTSGERFSP